MANSVLERYFIDLMEKCHPEGVSVEQYNEMRMAFFAGAQSLFWAINVISENYPEDMASGKIEELNQELQDYARSQGVDV